MSLEAAVDLGLAAVFTVLLLIVLPIRILLIKYYIILFQGTFGTVRPLKQDGMVQQYEWNRHMS